MVFFNDPMPCVTAPARAVRMAVAMRNRVERPRARTGRGSGHDLALGVGVAQGYATLGRVGFEGPLDYARHRHRAPTWPPGSAPRPGPGQILRQPAGPRGGGDHRRGRTARRAGAEGIREAGRRHSPSRLAAPVGVELLLEAEPLEQSRRRGASCGGTLTMQLEEDRGGRAALDLGRARVPISRTIAPPLPTRICFCDSVSTSTVRAHDLLVRSPRPRP